MMWKCKNLDSHQTNMPYSLEDTMKMLSLRKELTSLNRITRSHNEQKHSDKIILGETTFLEPVSFSKARLESNIQARRTRKSTTLK